MCPNNFCSDHLQHFLRNEPVVGIEYEAQLQKTILPREYLLLHVYINWFLKTIID